MGEAEFEQTALVSAVQGALVEQARDAAEGWVTTPGGRFQVRWDERGSASPMGQLAFFGEFLETGGVFERWKESCPLSYTSPNAPKVENILGTWLLSILDGHWRYAHVTGLRGDAVAPEILGMSKIISDESLRRALARLAPWQGKKCSEQEQRKRAAQLARSLEWMEQALAESTQEALKTGWILDCDATIKVLYGHQEGAEVAYNPHKPGRPSHVLHTYWVANLRLVLDVEVKPGKASASKHSLPRLVTLLESLPVEKRPRLVRGDNDFGTERVMAALEEIKQYYLFKLRQTGAVKRLIESQWSRRDWRGIGQGFEAVEATLQLNGWSRPRRVVVVRTAVKERPATEQNTRQGDLDLGDTNPPAQRWEYSVLVTNTDYPCEAIGQLYRDRADSENGFDELKNQWGWGGYTTHDLERCNLSARAVALVYNWWSWYVRLAHPAARREAITSRPALLSGVARLTHHAGKSRLLVTLTHAAGDQIKDMIANIRKGLDVIRATAPQLPRDQRWKALVRYIVDQILAAKAKMHPPMPPVPIPLGPPIMAG